MKEKAPAPETLVDKEKYQVFLFVCPAALPVSFAMHPWFVVNKKGEISRWEVFWRSSQNEMSWGHIHKNFYPPFVGIAKITFSDKYLWKNPRLIGYVEGDAQSLAARMVAFIEASPHSYLHVNEYHLLGPNSNTYVQWVLNNFPEVKLSLPRNSIGKDKDVNYKRPL